MLRKHCEYMFINYEIMNSYFSLTSYQQKFAEGTIFVRKFRRMKIEPLIKVISNLELITQQGGRL